jgi:hypothetical protein
MSCVMVIYVSGHVCQVSCVICQCHVSCHVSCSICHVSFVICYGCMYILCHNHVRCHVSWMLCTSYVISPVSCVIYQVSCVMFHLSCVSCVDRSTAVMSLRQSQPVRYTLSMMTSSLSAGRTAGTWIPLHVARRPECKLSERPTGDCSKQHYAATTTTATANKQQQQYQEEDPRRDRDCNLL